MWPNDETEGGLLDPLSLLAGFNLQRHGCTRLNRVGTGHVSFGTLCLIGFVACDYESERQIIALIVADCEVRAYPVSIRAFDNITSRVLQLLKYLDFKKSKFY